MIQCQHRPPDPPPHFFFAPALTALSTMNSSLSRVLDFSATQTHPRVSDDDISFLLRRSHGRSTWSHQGNLPPLPLPSLEETIGRFLKTVRPFANGNEAAMARMEEKARRFLRSDDAARRQRRLQALASASENWLSDMWVYGAYHSYRASLMLNSNVVGFPFDWRGSRTMWERDAPAVSRRSRANTLPCAFALLPVGLDRSRFESSPCTLPDSSPCLASLLPHRCSRTSRAKRPSILIRRNLKLIRSPSFPARVEQMDGGCVDNFNPAVPARP